MELEGKIDDFSKSKTQICNQMLAFIQSICLKCAVQLGVPDAIHNHGGPMKLSELVHALPIPTSRSSFLRRIMSVLVNSGLFSIKGNEADNSSSNEEDVYDLTATSKLLTGSTNSLAPLVLYLTGMEVAMAGHAMTTWMKGSDDDDNKNETPFHVAHGGKGVFEFASERPEFSALLNEAMACDSRLLMRQVVEEWGDMLFGGIRSLVDVGGGSGGAATVIAGAFPEIKCMVLDLAHVVDVQPKNESVEFVKGDMFVHVPPADAVLLKSVLHGLSDKHCVEILRNCKKSLSYNGNKGKMIIIDPVIQENRNDQDTIMAHYLLDAYVLTMCLGKERNEMEWKAMFSEAGFSRFKIVGELGIHSIMEVHL